MKPATARRVPTCPRASYYGRLGIGIMVCLVLCRQKALAVGQGVCNEAEKLRMERRFVAAEAAARQCLRRAPADARVWITLARALAGQGRYRAALVWTRRAAQQHPADRDILALRIRLLSWSGRLDAAQRLLKSVPSDQRATVELQRLAADLHFWRAENAPAVRAYSEYLSHAPNDATAYRNRGIAYRRLDRTTLAKADFDKACRLRGPGRSDAAAQSCALLSELDRNSMRYFLSVRPMARFVANQGDGWQLTGRFGAQLNESWRVNASVEQRNRSFSGTQRNDTYLQASVLHSRDNGFLLAAGAGATIAADFSPQWTMQIEPGYASPFGLELYLKYWQLHFRQETAHVLSPAAVYSFDRWTAYLRYYLGLGDSGGLRHQLFARISRTFLTNWKASLGIGGGNRSDFIEPRQNAANAQSIERSFVATTGLSYAFGRRHQIDASYLLRRESTAGLTYVEHQLSVGYGLRF